ncbi:MAG: O-antigen ligase family protein [Pirellulaceae bacterium]|nr:O-antigen ligase family protein [Pirellulaceae bacterium]
MGDKKKRVRRTAADSWLFVISAWGGRLSIIALLLYAPWYFGMVTWSQQLLLAPWLTVIAICTWICVMVKPEVARRANSPFLFCLCALLLLALAQLMPLPNWLHSAVAPTAAFERQVIAQAAEYLAVEVSDPQLLEAASQTGPADTAISIHPVQTRASLVGFSAAVLMFLCSGVLFNDKSSRRVLLYSLASITTMIALLGVLQAISWSQWTLLDMPGGSYFATFVSRNSAPQYLSVGIGCTIALLMASVKHKRRREEHVQRYRATNLAGRIRHSLEDSMRDIDALTVILTVALIVLLGGVVGAASRGGFVALLFALSITLLLALGRHRSLLVAGILACCVIAVLSLIFLESFELDQEIARRLEDQKLSSPKRLEFWKLALNQSQYWLTGSGLGSFHFAIMPGNTQQPYWIYHAENIFVEVFSELGFLGILATMVGLLWLARQLMFRSEFRAISFWPATLYAVSAIAVQSLVDFSLIIPAIFLTVAALVGVFVGESRQRLALTRPSRPGGQSRLWLTGLLAGLVALMWQGWKPLTGFAQSEPLEMQWSSIDSTQLDTAYSQSSSLDAGHPEVVLQLSRLKVAATEAYLKQSTLWPDSIAPDQRNQLSRQEFVTAVLRTKQPNFLPELAGQWTDNPGLAESVSASRAGFELASRHCVFDWRGHWGIFQSTIQVDPVKHALTCARLKLLTHSIPRMQQAVGTCSLIAGDRLMGLDFWRSTLFYHPDQAHRSAALLDGLIDATELMSILPASQLARAALIRVLQDKPNESQVALEMLGKLDIAVLKDELRTDLDWELMAWVAQQLEDEHGYIAALEKVAALRPLDKYVRFRLAKALQAQGDIEEAIRQMEQASRRSSLSVTEQLYLQQLRTLNAASPP